MTANNSKFYLRNMNRLVDQYNDTYHNSMNRKHLNAEYSHLT